MLKSILAFGRSRWVQDSTFLMSFQVMPLLGVWDQASRSKSYKALASLVVYLVKALPTLHHGLDCPSSRGFALSDAHFGGMDEFIMPYVSTVRASHRVAAPS